MYKLDKMRKYRNKSSSETTDGDESTHKGSDGNCQSTSYNSHNASEPVTNTFYRAGGEGT